MAGSITLIDGPMFAGKSERLIHHLRRAEIALERRGIPADQRCVAFRPTRDTRQSCVQSRAGGAFDALCVEGASEIPALAAEFDTVGIDEAQFFYRDPDKDGVTDPIERQRRANELRNAVFQMAQRGQHVLVAALSADFSARPFPSVVPLYAIATNLHRVYAVCMKCGVDGASFSQRLVPSKETFVVGDREYEARCLGCYEPPSS